MDELKSSIQSSTSSFLLNQDSNDLEEKKVKFDNTIELTNIPDAGFTNSNIDLYYPEELDFSQEKLIAKQMSYPFGVQKMKSQTKE